MFPVFVSLLTALERRRRKLRLTSARSWQHAWLPSGLPSPSCRAWRSGWMQWQDVERWQGEAQPADARTAGYAVRQQQIEARLATLQLSPEVGMQLPRG